MRVGCKCEWLSLSTPLLVLTKSEGKWVEKSLTFALFGQLTISSQMIILSSKMLYKFIKQMSKEFQITKHKEYQITKQWSQPLALEHSTEATSQEAVTKHPAVSKFAVATNGCI